MTLEQAKKLHSGDEVFWNDPDEGKCSKHIVIKHINVVGGIVIITDEHGGSLECFPEELS